MDDKSMAALISKMSAISQYNVAVKVGTILQQNYDGTYEIGMPGSAFPISRVEAQLNTTLQPGESGVIQFENNDHSQGRIIGRSPSRTGFSSASGSI